MLYCEIPVLQKKLFWPPEQREMGISKRKRSVYFNTEALVLIGKIKAGSHRVFYMLSL